MPPPPRYPATPQPSRHPGSPPSSAPPSAPPGAPTPSAGTPLVPRPGARSAMADGPFGEAPADRSPLAMAEDVFVLLVTGPAPLTIDGRTLTGPPGPPGQPGQPGLPGLPHRPIALHHLRARLIAQRLTPAAVDTVWAHLVARARTAPGGRRAGWTVGCVGVGMPILARATAHLSARYPGDPADIEAAVLAGFVAEIHRTDICQPGIARRLHVAAERTGRALTDTLRPPPATSTGPTAATAAGTGSGVGPGRHGERRSAARADIRSRRPAGRADL